MDIKDVLLLLIPILAGVVLSVVVYLVCSKSPKLSSKALTITWIAPFAVYILGYIPMFITDNGWDLFLPMVIAFGMFISAIIITIINKISTNKTNTKSSVQH